MLQASYKQFGMNISTGLAESLNKAGPEVQKEVQTLFGKLKDEKGLSTSELKSYWGDLGYTLPESMAEKLQKAGPKVQKEASDLLLKLENGTKLSGQELSTYFKDIGMNVPKSLSAGLSSMSGEAQKDAANLLAKLADGTSLNVGQVKQLWKDYGLQLPESLCNSLVSQSGTVQQSVLTVFQNLKSGTASSAEDLKNTFHTLGFDLPNTFIVGLKSVDAQKSAVELLEKVKSGCQLTGVDVIAELKLIGGSSALALANAFQSMAPQAQAAASSGGRSAIICTAQQFYNARGAGLKTDGYWGPATRKAATASVQRGCNQAYSAGLSVDSIWGPKTAAAVHTLRHGSNNESALSLQAVLMAHGYSVGSAGIDGKFGAGTEAAVRTYQRAAGLTVDGLAGKATFAALCK